MKSNNETKNYLTLIIFNLLVDICSRIVVVLSRKFQNDQN